MSHSVEDIKSDVKTLAAEVRQFLAATADAAGDKVEEGRKRLERALDTALSEGKHAADTACENSKLGARAASDAVRAHPLEAIGIALGLGAILVLSARWCATHRD